MATVTPTLVHRQPIFPHLLPQPPQPYPTPLPKAGRRIERLNARRDLEKEMADLSAEEEEIDQINLDLKNRGYKFIIPIGRTLTQEEERADQDESGDSEGDSEGEDEEEEETEGAESMAGEAEEEERDLDAEMDDMDDSFGNQTTAMTDPGDMDSISEPD